MNDSLKNLEWAFSDIQGANAYTMSRERPYDGEEHTILGERGKTLVEGLTIRDIADCIVSVLLQAGGIKRDNPIWDDIYSIEKQDWDYAVLVSHIMCNIETMMEIFPNIKEFKNDTENENKE